MMGLATTAAPASAADEWPSKPIGGTAEEMRQKILADGAHWKKVIEAAHITAE